MLVEDGTLAAGRSGAVLSRQLVGDAKVKDDAKRGRPLQLCLAPLRLANSQFVGQDCR